MQEFGIGFSFCGKHCTDMSCEISNNEETMHAIMDDFSTSSESVDGYDGEYPTGSTVKAREFEIKLLVEDVTDKELNDIGRWLGKGKSGQLIFDHRPYKYYNATVSAPVTQSTYVHFDAVNNVFLYSGTITTKLKAYVPYAYMIDEVKEAYPTVGTMKETLEAGSGIIAGEDMPAVSHTAGGARLIANIGNAIARPEIWITGIFTNGLTIENSTTGQSITITTDDETSQMYCIDSLMGRTTKWTGAQHPTTEAIRLANESATSVAADTVMSGNYVHLAPCFPMVRGVSYIGQDDTVNVSVESDNEWIGNYIYVDGWRKISSIDTDGNLVLETSIGVSVNDYGMVVDYTEGYLDLGDILSPVMFTVDYNEDLSAVSYGTTHIMRMNEITVTVDPADTLDKISFCFRPTFY